MSSLLDEIIRNLKAKRLDYEQYLKQIADLAKQVWDGHTETMSERLNTPGLRALYNNLSQDEDLAIQIDDAVKIARPDSWRGVQTKELVIKATLYGILKNTDEVERIFLIIKQQAEY